ncbi:MAG: hypothetical protein GX033_03335 [Firmicutes bacterium]|nr:hypothetical protein [Bacillota bacterium]
MKDFLVRLIRLLWGLFLFALGIAITLNAQIGYAPWDVLNAGLANTLGISIGTASISVGLVIIILTVLLKEKVGLGSLGNMLLIGMLLDIILASQVLPVAGNLLQGISMLVAGLIIIALASYYYIGSGFGAGPRDSLMVAVTRRTGLPVGVCRGAIELAALLAGWWLGGMVGVGTVISAFLTGPIVELIFRLFKFDVTQVQHETLGETFRGLRRSTARG